MGKCVAYVAAAVVCIGIGALVAGLAVWYTHPQMLEDSPNESRTAMCVLSGTTKGTEVSGTLTLKQNGPKVFTHITGNVSGLSVGLHGFHVHEFGVNGANEACVDAKGHYNPDGYNHSAPNATQRHVGDLGNIESFPNGTALGTAIIDIKDSISMFGMRSVVGRSIVIHENRDDLGLGNKPDSLTTGNAGSRLACCNIYIVPNPTN
ncbi:superoxide dismutase [Cu-Zn] 5 [Procambarus clarkii]|uniref:superoxide dismutase [Cu-Zn] 5 n=1 Tax=Procambarus clarkii TaxID=6728 RepID=UPI003743F453